MNPGARPLKRALSRLMVDPIARMLLTGEIKDGQTVEADAGEDSRLVFRALPMMDFRRIR